MTEIKVTNAEDAMHVLHASGIPHGIADSTTVKIAGSDRLDALDILADEFLLADLVEFAGAIRWTANE